MIGLKVIGGPLRGQFFPLQEGRQLIGRDPTNQIILDSPMVSRQHAEIQVGRDQVVLRNLSQANGTIINFKRVEETILKRGDQIFLGEFILEFVDQDPQVAALRKETVVDAFAAFPQKPIGPAAVPAAPAAWTRLSWTTLVMGGILLTIFLDHLIITQLFSQRIMREVTVASLARAREVVRYLAEKNRLELDLNHEDLLDIEVATSQDGVVQASIANSSLRILAPTFQINQPLEDEESKRALALTTNDVVVSGKLPGNLYRLAAPVRIYRNQRGSYENIGVATIHFSPKNLAATREANRRLGLISLILVPLVGLFIFFMVRLITLAPIRYLIEMTSVLFRGGVERLERQCSIAELTPLIDAINAYAARQQSLGDASPASQLQPIDILEKNVGLAELKWILPTVSDAMMLADASGMILALNQKAKAMLKVETTVKTAVGLERVVTDQNIRAFLVGCMQELMSSQGASLTKTLEYGDFAYQFTLHGYAGTPEGGLKYVLVVIEKI